MENKRILLCCNRTLNLGGIEKSLTTFLQVFNTKENRVLLVLHDDAGPLTADLPLDEIEVFYTRDIDSVQLLKDDIKHFRLIEVVKGLWNRMRLRRDEYWYTRIMYTYRIIKRGLVFPGSFDCAISFTTDYSDLSMVAGANAAKRVCYVHGDASQSPYAARLNDHLVRQMDKIYAVSEQAKQLFLTVHPRCTDAMDVMHNVILESEVIRKAQGPAPEMEVYDGIKLCTVGRLVPEKGQGMIPQIARLLLDGGLDFRWYLVGDGSLRHELEEQIEALHLQEHVILLGSKSDPYPYVRNCDVYVQTSFTEAYCITVAEARILCKPIVTTRFPGIDEQIRSGENGLIVDTTTPPALADAIARLLGDPQMQATFIQTLQNARTKNEDPLEKLYEFIES